MHKKYCKCSYSGQKGKTSKTLYKLLESGISKSKKEIKKVLKSKTKYYGSTPKKRTERVNYLKYVIKNSCDILCANTVRR